MRSYSLKPGTTYIFRHEADGVRVTKLGKKTPYEGPGSTGMFTIEVDEPTEVYIGRVAPFDLEDAPPAEWTDQQKIAGMLANPDRGGRSRLNAKRMKLIRAALIERDGPNCCECGFPPPEDEVLTIDHIVRQADGGTHALNNLRLMCEACHVWHHWSRTGYG